MIAGSEESVMHEASSEIIVKYFSFNDLSIDQ